MPKGAKIATCCYCGTRAVLVLRGTTRHELSCAACGAPLSRMKQLREERGGKPVRPAPDAPPGPKRQKKSKRRKGLWRKAVEELGDAIEDIFD